MKPNSSSWRSAHRIRWVNPCDVGWAILIHRYPARSQEKKKWRSITWLNVPSIWPVSLGNSFREKLQSSKGFSAADLAQNIEPDGKSKRRSSDIFTPILRAVFFALLKFHPHPRNGRTGSKCWGAIIPSLGST